MLFFLFRFLHHTSSALIHVKLLSVFLFMGLRCRQQSSKAMTSSAASLPTKINDKYRKFMQNDKYCKHRLLGTCVYSSRKKKQCA